MDLSFTMRIRKQRLRDRVAPADLPLLFARLAARQAASATAVLQRRLDHVTTVDTDFAQRVAVFAGGPVGRRPDCAAFARRAVASAGPAVTVNAPFTLGLQRSFKPQRLEDKASNEHIGAATPARGLA